MASGNPPCSRCGTAIPPGADRCPVCGQPVPAPNPAAGTHEATRGPERPPDGRAAEVARRVARLRQWADGSQALGVTIPILPSWAEEATRHSTDAVAWLEVVRGVERIAQQKVLVAFEAWERSTRNRLSRLEAYSVDGRLERDQIDEVLHAARQGDLTLALQSFQQVDRVVALKERHLDQAREELERLVSLLRDMDALAMAPPMDPAELAKELEEELRGGHLAPLKQKLRSIRLQTVNRLKTTLPPYITEYGAYILRERSDGSGVELEATELARAARAFHDGRPEEALRRLRLLQQVHGSVASTATRPPRDGGGSAPTGASPAA